MVSKCVCLCVCTRAQRKSRHEVFPSTVLECLFLHPGLKESASLASQLVPGLTCLCVSSGGITGRAPCLPALRVGTCMTSALSTEPSPQPSQIRVLNSLSLREIQIKTALRLHVF